MNRIKWNAFPHEQSDPLKKMLVVTYDANNRPVIVIAWFDTYRQSWNTTFGPLPKPVTHFAFLPDLPADVLTPAQVRELEDK